MGFYLYEFKSSDIMQLDAIFTCVFLETLGLLGFNNF